MRPLAKYLNDQGFQRALAGLWARVKQELSCVAPELPPGTLVRRVLYEGDGFESETQVDFVEQLAEFTLSFRQPVGEHDDLVVFMCAQIDEMDKPYYSRITMSKKYPMAFVRPFVDTFEQDLNLDIQVRLAMQSAFALQADWEGDSVRITWHPDMNSADELMISFLLVALFAESEIAYIEKTEAIEECS